VHPADDADGRRFGWQCLRGSQARYATPKRTARRGAQELGCVTVIFRVSRAPLLPLIVARERFTRSVRPREPEPMVMDESQGVAEYDHAGVAAQAPLHHFNALALSRLLPEGGVLLDLGCGSGRLVARLARGRPDVRCVGLDLSEPILKTGRRLLALAGIGDRVELRPGDITRFEKELPQRLDLVSCNFAPHQLPNDELVERCLEAIARTRNRTGCGVYIFNFIRLRNPRSWPALMSLAVVPGPVFLHDSIASERAAFTFAELTDLLRRAGLVTCGTPVLARLASTRCTGLVVATSDLRGVGMRCRSHGALGLSPALSSSRSHVH
jgi:arsenite methyltransferase